MRENFIIKRNLNLPFQNKDEFDEFNTMLREHEDIRLEFVSEKLMHRT